MIREKLFQKVVIGADKIKGCYRYESDTLADKVERENVVQLQSCLLTSVQRTKKDAEKYVKLGDYVTFDTEFMPIGSNVKGKALDRSGICTSLINAIEKEYKYDTYMCFWYSVKTVQEARKSYRTE